MQLINHMSIEFSSIPANVAFARVAVAAFASQLDFTLNELDDLKVSVSEAVSNAIIHGYGNAPGHIVRVSVKIYRDLLEVMVEDSGKGIEDVQRALEAEYSTDPERMGLGFTFMQSLTDKLEVDSTPGKGTRVTMSKMLNGSKSRRGGH